MTTLVAAPTAHKDELALEHARVETTTAGRIISIRSFGKASFLVLSDGRQRIQVYRPPGRPERS